MNPPKIFIKNLNDIVQLNNQEQNKELYAL